MLAARFALTKIQPPRARPELIQREELEQRLQQALHSAKLVLLCAPAGFGKTAALTRQLRQLNAGVAVAWLACDEDDDLHRVLDCLCAALEPYDLPWRVAPEAIASAAGPDRSALRRTADAVLNALAGADTARGIIVLEDVHRIADPAVFNWCDLLIERLPPNWTLVLSSRVEPPLALARLRALGELAEFRTEDLRFSPDEARALVEAAQPGAPAERLWLRTQGWPAGLRLALNADAGGARAAADRHAFDYLVAEVLDALPVRLRQFLLRSSVLPELSARRCELVTGHADSAALLEETEQRGLFVSMLEGDELTLTLHDLFRDCLEDRLARELPQELPQLLRRAADSEPDTQRRIHYLLRGGHWGQAQAVLEADTPMLVGHGAVDSVFRLIEQFPPTWRQQAPALYFIEGVAHWARWSFPRMADALQRGLHGYERQNDITGAQRCTVYHAVALCGQGLIRASAQQIDTLLLQPMPDDVHALARLLQTWHTLDSAALDRVPALYTQVIELLERVDRPEIWSRCQTLPPFIGLPGMAPVLERYARGAQRHIGEAPSTLSAGTRAVQACSLLWQGKFDAALVALEAAEDDMRWLDGPLSVAAFVRTVRALWHAWRGEADAALAATQRLLDDLDDPRSRDRRRVWLGYYRFVHARIALLVQDNEALRAMHQQLQGEADTFEPALLALQRAALPAHLAWAEGRLEAACSGYAEALTAHEASLRVLGQHIEIRLRLAHAQQALGRHAAALQSLLPLLTLVQDDQAAAPLMAGARVLADLAGGPLAASAPPALRERLTHWHRRAQWLRAGASPAAAIPPSTPSAPAAATTAVGAGTTPLSERELEVLALLAAGDSNKLIARALDLSPHTVKRHVANILDKLALSSRGQAAAWHRAHQQG